MNSSQTRVDVALAARAPYAAPEPSMTETVRHIKTAKAAAWTRRHGFAGLTSAAITEFKISDSTSVSCDSNEGFWAEVQSWLIPQFAGDIYGAVNAPIEDAINGEFTTLIDDYNLDTCGSS